MDSEFKFFDSAYYLTTYPDIKAAGVDPLDHYLKFGRFEQRLPCELESVKLEKLVWREGSVVLTNLLALSTDADASPVDALFANWFLARFFAYKLQWSQAVEHLEAFWRSSLAETIFPHDGPLCLTSMCLKEHDSVDLYKVLQSRSFFNRHHEFMCRIMQHEEGRKNELPYQWTLLLGLDTQVDVSPTTFDDLTRYRSKHRASHRKKVSVIVPCYNGAKTVATSLTSLKYQSWQNIEVIVVDDASTDDSVDVIKSLIKDDDRFKLIALQENKGAYFARNEGARRASGHYITVMDVDDWSHPQKIELQVKALLKNPFKKASISHWARATNDLTFTHWRIENGWVHPNISSLMIKRSVLKRLGFWDEVKAGADTEYYARLVAHYGPKSIVEVAPGRLLSVGRVQPGSLTLASDTHITTFFEGARADYQLGFARWHAESKKRFLFLPVHAANRKFSAPRALLTAHKPTFDAQWYLDAYADVAKSGMCPFKHYQKYGQKEGREPSPYFSASATKYLGETGAANQGAAALPVIRGEKMYRPDRPTWVFFGHAAGPALFGAERSLLDVLKSIGDVEKNIVLVLPNAENADYIKDALGYSCFVHIVPMPWWRGDRGINVAVKSNLEYLIQHYNSELCYVNTLTLWEPIISANTSGVPVVLQVREIPEHDKALCNHLNATPGIVAKHLKSLNCDLWANSGPTKWWMLNSDISPQRIRLLYDGIDVNTFIERSSNEKSEVSRERPLVVGMLSSNLLKKGIKDFYKVQMQLSHANIQFKLFGPPTKHVKIQNSTNYRYMGYFEDPADAMSQCNVILCLSHCQESFGRTAVEAMAAGCTVIAYDWGALGEVIGDAGILVPLKDTDAVCEQLEAILADRIMLESYADAARGRAAQFSLEVLGDTFQLLAEKALSQYKAKTHLARMRKE